MNSNLLNETNIFVRRLKVLVPTIYVCRTECSLNIGAFILTVESGPCVSRPLSTKNLPLKITLSFDTDQKMKNFLKNHFIYCTLKLIVFLAKVVVASTYNFSTFGIFYLAKFGVDLNLHISKIVGFLLQNEGLTYTCQVTVVF